MATYTNPRWGFQIKYTNSLGDVKTRTVQYVNLIDLGVSVDGSTVVERPSNEFNAGYNATQLQSFAQQYAIAAGATFNSVSAIGRYDVM